ncbi:MAG: radical SAM protein [Planctomycetota bacterium]|nr:MAG: radical SAM protein [Planctomycetota bacterium]
MARIRVGKRMHRTTTVGISQSAAPKGRPPKSEVTSTAAALPLSQRAQRALFVDLNNFSTFPTLAVGILVASLRNAGFEVEVLCPLAHDVPAAEREKRETIKDDLMRRVHLSTHPLMRAPRDAARRARLWWRNRPHPRVLREAARILDSKPDVLLLSAYLQHYSTVVELGRLAAARGIPVLLGGPVFNHHATAEVWRTIPGLCALVAGEVDLTMPEIVAGAIRGDDLLKYDGVVLPDGRRSPAAPPLRQLDRIPVPDFSDFPWDRYRTRVIPLMTGRGCQWNRCVFCSDIVSVSGRTFRTKSVDAVMHEVRELAMRHECTNFLFLDIKLNSDPRTLRGIVEHIQRNAPGAQWVGTVHVDQRKDNGLSRAELRAAVAAGMRRVSFGLESGSQRVLDLMDKGCSVELNQEFIRNAYDAGLSVRCTMIRGFPGETAEDVVLTAEFLERNSAYIDRIRANDLAIIEGTPLHKTVRDEPTRFPELKVLQFDHRQSWARYVNVNHAEGAYRKAVARMLDAVYAINRREVRRTARAFDGLM